jgi:hypothetical protein
MKKVALAALLWPVTLVGGWLSTRLAERYEAALDMWELEFEDVFDDE